MAYSTQVARVQLQDVKGPVSLIGAGSKNATLSIVEVDTDGLQKLCQEIQTQRLLLSDSSAGGVADFAQQGSISDIQYTALVYGHGRTILPQAYVEACRASFPTMESTPAEQWLLLRNSTFPYSCTQPFERDALQRIEPLIWQLIAAGNAVVTVYLVLKLKKRNLTSAEQNITVTNNYVAGDMVTGHGILAKGHSQIVLGASQVTGEIAIHADDAELSAQLERPQGAAYKTVFALRSPATEQLAYFSSQSPYLNPGAVQQVLADLEQSQSCKDTVEITQKTHQLGELGPVAAIAVPELANCLGSQVDGDLRRLFLDVLGDIGTTDAVDALLAHTAVAQSAEERQVLLTALLRIGSPPALQGVFDNLVCFKPGGVVQEIAARQMSDELLERMLKAAMRCPSAANSRYIAHFLSSLEPLHFLQFMVAQLKSVTAAAERQLVLQTIAEFSSAHWQFETDSNSPPMQTSLRTDFKLANAAATRNSMPFLRPVGPSEIVGLGNAGNAIHPAPENSSATTTAQENTNIQVERHESLQQTYEQQSHGPQSQLQTWLKLLRRVFDAIEGILVAVLLPVVGGLVSVTAYWMAGVPHDLGVLMFLILLGLVAIAIASIVNGFYLLQWRHNEMHSCTYDNFWSHERVYFYVPVLILIVATVLTHLLFGQMI